MNPHHIDASKQGTLANDRSPCEQGKNPFYETQHSICLMLTMSPTVVHPISLTAGWLFEMQLT